MYKRISDYKKPEEDAHATKVEEDRFSTELAPRFDAKLEEEHLKQFKKKFPDTPDCTSLSPSEFSF